MVKDGSKDEATLKPIGKAGIETCRRIYKSYTSERVGAIVVDAYMAGAIVITYDALDEANKIAMERMSISKASQIAFAMMDELKDRS